VNSSCVLIVAVGATKESDQRYVLRYMDNKKRIVNGTVVNGSILEKGGREMFWFVI